MRLEPFGNRQNFTHKHLPHADPPLNRQMATLTQCRKIPLGAIGLVAVKMVDGQNVKRRDVVRVFAALAFPPGSVLDCGCYILPVPRVIVGRVIVHGFQIFRGWFSVSVQYVASANAAQRSRFNP